MCIWIHEWVKIKSIFTVFGSGTAVYFYVPLFCFYTASCRVSVQLLYTALTLYPAFVCVFVLTVCVHVGTCKCIGLLHKKFTLYNITFFSVHGDHTTAFCCDSSRSMASTYSLRVMYFPLFPLRSPHCATVAASSHARLKFDAKLWKTKEWCELLTKGDQLVQWHQSLEIICIAGINSRYSEVS